MTNRVGLLLATRNGLINEAALTLKDRHPNRNDISHEGFVSPDHFDKLVAMCRAAIAMSSGNPPKK